MTTLNAYATLAEYKSYTLARGGTASTDTADDAIIESLLRAASRLIDRYTGRRFYPSIETHYFDVPSADDLDPRKLKLDDDFLEITSLVNGDGTTIPSTEYDLVPKSKYPAYALRLKDNSTYVWASDGAGNTHQVIAVTGIVGYHSRYGIAWLAGSTLNEDLDDSETGIDVVAGTAFAVGNIIRIENELSYLSAVVTNTLTGTRGENSSTATTHANTTPVKIWQIEEDVHEYCLLVTRELYNNRRGNGAQVATVTAAGVVLQPEGIPARMLVGLAGLRKIV